MKLMGDRSQLDSWLEIFVSELIGTGFLMYMGCLGMFAAANEWKELSALQIALIWGFTVSSIIVAVGHLSKAHLNPSVTLCTFLLGDISLLTAGIYLIAEVLGGLLGMCILRVSVPSKLYSEYNEHSGPCGFCSTNVHPDISLLQAFFFEFFGTCFLIMAVCSLFDPRNASKGDSNPMKIGLLIVVICLALGPFTGGSLNPARSLAPAIVNNGWKDQWLYWVAPLSGSAVTTLVYKYAFLSRLKSPESGNPADADQSTAMLKSNIAASLNENEVIVEGTNHVV